MSETYFDILPEEIIISILCNFTIDRAVHSLIKVIRHNDFNENKFYRKICVRLFSEMATYPEEMEVEGVHISWMKLYLAVSTYAGRHKNFNKFEFYWEWWYDETCLLMLYDYLLISKGSYKIVDSCDDLIVFIDTIMYINARQISGYVRTYFSNILSKINKRRYEILMERVLTFKSSPKISTAPHIGEYKVDPDGNTVYVKIYKEDDKDINIYYEGKLARYIMCKKGYLEWHYAHR